MSRKSSPIWHPFTQHAIYPEMVKIARAEGAYLYTDKDEEILDAVSSWWINIHGHCHPKIVGAIRDQADKVDQVIFAGFTHDPAEQLAEKLVDVTPEGLDYVFFSDSGSTSVEVALKMAVGYWHHRGKNRTKIIALENSYHGDTFGTMSAGARCIFSAAYEPYLFDVIHLPFPDDPEETLNALEDTLKTQGDDVAAFICEPLVLGAGGMLMYSPDTLKKIHALCQQYGVLFIADEVMTGWGRTGTMFACEQAGITPDMICLSKGMTNGYLPLAVTLCISPIYDAFYSKDRSKTFFHSSSYSGNAFACAAALASLKIWEDEPVRERIATTVTHQKALLARLSVRDDIANLRQTGTIAAFDVEVRNQAGYLSVVGPELYQFFLQNGVLLRPLGNTVYILPPYCLKEKDFDRIGTTIERALDFLQDAGTKRAA